MFKTNKIKIVKFKLLKFNISGNNIMQKSSGEKHLEISPQTKEVDIVNTINNINNHFCLKFIRKNIIGNKNVRNLREENTPMI